MAWLTKVHEYAGEALNLIDVSVWEDFADDGSQEAIIANKHAHETHYEN